MSARLGSNKGIGIRLYERAVYAPSREQVYALKAEFSATQKAYLDRFKESEVYRAFSSLEDLITTSQGAESQMSADLRNNIRSVEPQKMLLRVVLLQRTKFLRRQDSALSCTSPVPPRTQNHLAYLIQRAQVYRSSVRFLDGTSQMEATVASQHNGTVLRLVRLSNNSQTPPSCCAYSTNGSGIPCWYGVAVLLEKYGPSNLYRFIEARHLTSAWVMQYANVEYSLPSQARVDDILLNAKKLVGTKENLQIPKALPPPRGRPVQRAGRRRKTWYEKGSEAKKKRVYSCYLCRMADHTVKDCFLKKLYGDTAE